MASRWLTTTCQLGSMPLLSVAPMTLLWTRATSQY
jgi:hypothetical protein